MRMIDVPLRHMNDINAKYIMLHNIRTFGKN